MRYNVTKKSVKNCNFGLKFTVLNFIEPATRRSSVRDYQSKVVEGNKLLDMTKAA